MAVSAIGALELAADGLDLEATLLGGQSFSWRKAGPGAFTGVAGGRAVALRACGATLTLANLDGAPMSVEDGDFWRHYLALDADYDGLCRRLSAHPALAACVAHSPGLRVLRQPFFETLLAFIISQNNHIPRITGIVERLRAGFGRELAAGEHAFPEAAALAALEPEALAPIRAGFRAKYLIDAARRVAQGQVEEAALRAMPTGEARAKLMEINGVGPKVADCVLLFSLERTEVAPMDVWMKRAVERHFGGGLPECAEGIEGIAQQFIFSWAREHIGRGG